ncbi:MAG: sulfatase [Verrucomicrobiota bacterium]
MKPVFLAVVLSLLATMAQAAPAKPNILWITTEDMSPTLGCYGDQYARTPNLDRFARESVRYTHAFASAPVCSPARSCLITGLYATSLGTQRLRSEFPIPAGFKGFPAYLRAEGYFCSNNVKTDYNVANEKAFIAEAWDRSDAKAHWRQRKPGQPFFSVFNLMMTHQSRTSVWSWDEFEKEVQPYLKPAERHDPAKAPVPPYYPDTPIVRRTIARFYDCVAAMDKIVAGILKELEEDGLAEDTIVFFFSDHGSGLPRHKRLLHDSGLHVPLMVRFPPKYAQFAPAKAGETTGRMVSFVDFAPTVLSLAGLPVPDYLQGRAFLGPRAGDAVNFVHGARDRVDEAFDLSRSVRDRQYLYVRNYMPHVSWNQPEGYSDAADMRREITRLAAEGKLNAAQMAYAGPRKPLEELYDVQADPQQLHNLAGSPQHRAALDRLRRLQQVWSRSTRDAGFLPEADAWERSRGGTVFDLAKDSRRYPLERIMEAADLVGRPNVVSQQMKFLRHPDSAVRYWAAVGLQAAGRDAERARNALRLALQDTSPSVRVAAAAALAGLGDADAALAALMKEMRGAQLDAALEACRALQFMGAAARPALPAMKEVLTRAKQSEKEHPAWLFIRFSLEAAIAKLEA